MKEVRLIDANEILKSEHQHYDYMADEYYVTVRDIENAQTVDAVSEWTPITARPMDAEERLEWSEKLGYDIAYDDGEALIYTSQLPDDGQEVLVCGRNGRVWIDKFMSDPDYGCYFEEYEDMDGIVAWMPLPKPYRERREDEADRRR